MLIDFRYMPASLIKGILHVGAHEAEELPDYCKAGIERVAWVEANPSKWKLLEEKLANYPTMLIGKFAAAAETGGSVPLNVANNGQSTSILELGTHASRYPSIRYEQRVSAQLVAVDDWISSVNISRKDLNFINLDIQGYELSALKGMRKQLAFCDFVYTEVNFEEVYVGCALLSDLDLFLGDYGFDRVALVDTGAGWGDALYAKKHVKALKIKFGLLFFARRLWRSFRQSLKRVLVYRDAASKGNP
jgi:FkbM family methyltransferase